MIAKKFRTPRQNISYILEKGENLTSKLFIVRYKKNEEQFSRYRVIISRKLHPKAVNRNKLRRQIYETLRLNPLQNVNFDLVMIPKKRILKTSYQEITQDIEHLWKDLTKF